MPKTAFHWFSIKCSLSLLKFSLLVERSQYNIQKTKEKEKKNIQKRKELFRRGRITHWKFLSDLGNCSIIFSHFPKTNLHQPQCYVQSVTMSCRIRKKVFVTCWETLQVFYFFLSLIYKLQILLEKWSQCGIRLDKGCYWCKYQPLKRVWEWVGMSKNTQREISEYTLQLCLKYTFNL